MQASIGFALAYSADDGVVQTVGSTEQTQQEPNVSRPETMARPTTDSQNAEPIAAPVSQQKAPDPSPQSFSYAAHVSNVADQMGESCHLPSPS